MAFCFAAKSFPVFLQFIYIEWEVAVSQLKCKTMMKNRQLKEKKKNKSFQKSSKSPLIMEFARIRLAYILGQKKNQKNLKFL